MIIAARPSVGKTAFALNLAMKVARANNANVLVFSLEMKAKQLAYRIMSNLARVPAGEIKNGNIARTKEKELERLEELSKIYDVYIDDSFTNKVADIKDKVIQFKKNNKVAMIIIDYIQLLQPSKFSNKYEGTSEISRDLKQLAYELEIPVMALSQLNRNVEQNKKDSEPKMSDLRDSGSLEQDADMVMLMSRSDYQNDDKSKTSNVRVRVAKCRNGSTGNADFWYYRDNSLFVEQEEGRE